MTREDALKVLDTIPTIGEQVDALEMAIEALEQEPCEDAISRAWLKESIHNFYHGLKHTPTEEDIQAYIDVAPSVTPQPKVGEWLEKEVNSETAIMVWQSARCSVCDKYHTTPYMYYFSHYDWCPNCGSYNGGD